MAFSVEHLLRMGLWPRGLGESTGFQESNKTVGGKAAGDLHTQSHMHGNMIVCMCAQTQWQRVNTRRCGQ